ncbi:mitochondrial substrate carrier family protein L [Kluyveromyces marxianus DMKU3-1042]|uniref:Mitochondrial substrate carrier family protein L n=1 Tax=Kluyveromyces marxianus (strain DMKU3-1042 / BCC 29191 / NBRC 104275) TaxID=1003335 RepID=W0TJR0_KLUMD|nr:mitochondrial substrate carrier family protein L [Kluyveromyces marxianus DMKU3-1042]BAO42379.1 mitochondrial substrate carrier family protein L [Kluyveromyces marxianus DMKU3-1042]
MSKPSSSSSSSAIVQPVNSLISDETYSRIMGFVAGVFSGVAKNAVGHPFDTIKVRLQTSQTEAKTRFSGPLDCVYKTFKTQGIRGFYLGFTPPLVGWIMMDSVMLGCLHNYRMLLRKYVYTEEEKLPLSGCILSGVMAGWSVSFIAPPIELAKAKLQVQYDQTTTRYKGPLDVIKKVYSQQGIRGLYKGLISTLIFRTHFVYWWGSYELLTRWFREHTNMSETAINFWAGGFSASFGFWTTAYPSDVVKQVVLCNDKYDGSFKSWRTAVKDIYQARGVKGFFKGFVPSFLRSFPANAAALAAFEFVLRTSGAKS